MSDRLDFLSIGDITTDDFIDLKDVRIDTDPDKEDRGHDEICFRFGDKIEYESHKVIPAVGNSPNAAVSAHRLGLNAALYTNLGDDEVGQKTLSWLDKEGLSQDYISVHEGKHSNYHYVLRNGPERTILINHAVYPYQMPELTEPPRWLYVSSFGETGKDFHHEIAEYLTKNPETSLAFQPGTFQIELGIEEIQDLYQETDIFFCNKEESQRILQTQESDIQTLLTTLQSKGPRIVVITDGPEGAYAFDGDQAWHMPMYPDPKPPVDRTGAGDSFSSTFTSALALGKDIPTALSWGPINSMSVVQYIGAQEGLLTQDKLLEHLSNAPENYTPNKL